MTVKASAGLSTLPLVFGYKEDHPCPIDQMRVGVSAMYALDPIEQVVLTDPGSRKFRIRCNMFPDKHISTVAFI